MKKILFFVMAVFVCASMGAQVVTSTSFKKGKTGTVWYVKAGANFSKLSAEGESTGSLFGYNVGIAFDRPIGTNGFFWGSGLQLATKGFKEGDYKLNAHKLEIPISVLGYKFNVTEDIAIDARLGGFVNYDLFGKISDDEESVNIGDLDEYDRFSAGIQGGVGVWYQKLNLNITYQSGLVKQNECKERNLMISLGYAF